MRWIIRSIYWLVRTPPGQTAFVTVLVGVGLFYSYFKIAQNSEQRLVVIGAAAAVAVAIWGVVNQWAISRRSLTVQFMRQLETDKEYVESIDRFIQATRHPGGVLRLANGPPADPAELDAWEKQEAAVRLILNMDELMAIGVRNSALDYRVICTLSHRSIQRRWAYAKDYVTLLRNQTSTPTMFLETERLACRLRDDDIHSLL
jgi:Domain of unknown function (DUF4760)